MTDETLIQLAAALGLESLADTPEDGRRILAAVAQQRIEIDATCQERDHERARVQALTAELEALTAEVDERIELATRAIRVDGLIADAYRSGKLLHPHDSETGTALPSPNEKRLRRLAARDGFDALVDELSSMPALVRLGHRALDNVDGRAHSGGELSAALASVAEQLGLDERDLVADMERAR